MPECLPENNVSTVASDTRRSWLKMGGIGSVATGFFANLAAYWNLDEVSGTRADQSGNGNNLAVSGTVGSLTGKIDLAADFTQAGYLSITDNATFSITGSFTFVFGVYPDGFSAIGRGLIGKWGTNDKEFAVYIGIAGNELLSFYVSADGTNENFVHDTTGLTINQWAMVTVVYDDTDGLIKISTNAATFNTEVYNSGIFDGSADFVVGADWQKNGPNAFDGRIDEIGFWKRALTQEEVTTLYNAGLGKTYPFT